MKIKEAVVNIWQQLDLGPEWHFPGQTTEIPEKQTSFYSEGKYGQTNTIFDPQNYRTAEMLPD